MKPELWLNRADHELAMAQELLDAGSLLWAASYSYRAVEYALEGLIFMKTGARPEKGAKMRELQSLAEPFLPDMLNKPVSDLVQITPLVWQSDLTPEQIGLLTESRTRDLIEGAGTTIAWIEQELDQGREKASPGA